MAFSLIGNINAAQQKLFDIQVSVFGASIAFKWECIEDQVFCDNFVCVALHTTMTGLVGGRINPFFNINAYGCVFKIFKEIFSINETILMSTANFLNNQTVNFSLPSPVCRSCRIRRLHFCRWVRPKPNECVAYDTKLHLMVRFQSWRFGEGRVALHYHYSQVHITLEW